MTVGIYAITSIFENKTYIGSSNDIEKRYGEHISQLKCKTHGNVLLQKSFNKFGTKGFDLKIIEEVKKEELLDKNYLTDLEKIYISTVDCEFNLKDNAILTNKQLEVKRNISKRRLFRKFNECFKFYTSSDKSAIINLTNSRTDNLKNYGVVNLSKPWYYGHTGGELSLLFDMLLLENSETDLVHLSEMEKERISKAMGVSLSQVNKNLKGLLKKGNVIRVSRGIYKLNPDLVFKGSTTKLPIKFEQFLDLMS